MVCPRGLFCLLLCAVALAQRPAPALAQTPAPYRLALRGVPLEDALAHLTHLTRIDLAYDPALVREERVFCVTKAPTAEAALSCVLEGTGLDFYRLSSGMYVLTPAAEVAPAYGQLRGLVISAESGEPLSDAHLVLSSGALATLSGSGGHFSFPRLKPGRYRLYTSYVGYEERLTDVEVPPDGPATVTIALEPEAAAVEPIIVEGLVMRRPSAGLGTEGLPREAFILTPSAGVATLGRGLDALMGVQLSDVTADIHIQGGDAGDHQFQVDGAPVYMPYQLGTLIGPFSSFAIGRITVQKAGFGAQHGSQMGAIVQAEHALEIVPQGRFDVQVDPMSANARLQYGLGQPGRLSFAGLLAARYGLWGRYEHAPVQNYLDAYNQADPFIGAAFSPPADTSAWHDASSLYLQVPASPGNPSLGFQDVHTAARLRLGLRHSVHASFYLGARMLASDQSRYTDLTVRDGRDRYTWLNRVGQVRYEAVVSPRLLLSARLRSSHYRLRHEFGFPNSLAGEDLILEGDDDGNRIQETGLETRLDYALGDRTHIQAGVDPVRTSNQFLIQGTQRLPIYHSSSMWRVASFVTSRIDLSRTWHIDVGTRLTYVAPRRVAYPEPRLAVRYDAPGERLPWSLRLSTGLYRQFVNQFDVSSLSPRALLSTARVWLTTDATVAPPLSSHYAAEALLHPSPDWTLRAEGYYKQHLHLLAIDYAATPPSDTDATFAQSEFLLNGEGYSRGLGLMAERRWDENRLRLRYEYGFVERGTERKLYGGRFYPVPWNEPHRFELDLDWALGGGVTTLMRWRGVWGRRWAFRQAYYDFIGAYESIAPTIPPVLHDNIVDHVDAFALRTPTRQKLPPIFELNLSLAYTRVIGATRLQARADLLNAFGQRNVAEWHFVADPDHFEKTGLLMREQRLMLPFTPALAIRVGW